MIRPPALHRLLALPILLAALLMLAGCSSEAEKRYNQAIEAERHQDWEQARELYQAALALDAELAEAHINLGALALRLKQLDLAEQHSHQALQLLEHKKKSLVSGFSWEKQAGLACNNLASVAFERVLQAQQAADDEILRQQLALAREWIDKALALDPDNEKFQHHQRFLHLWPN